MKDGKRWKRGECEGWEKEGDGDKNSLRRGGRRRRGR